jgi:Leucine-rich repeat (LRR) protein
MEHNDRNEDVKANVQGANEKIPQIVRNRGMERFQYFQSIKNKTVFPQNTLSHRQFDTEALQRVCTNYSERSLKKLPSEILDYPTPPTFLDLSKNKFEYFPLEIIQLHNLKSLTLDHNKIKCIPSEIIKLPMLEYFSIGHNLI